METVASAAQIDELQRENEIVLVYFGSPSCGVCRDILPKLERMLENYPHIKAVRVETQNLPELSAGYGVFAIPVILLFIQGRETLREGGIISLDRLEPKIARYYGLLFEDGGQAEPDTHKAL